MAKLIDIGFPSSGSSISIGATIADDSGNGNTLTVADGAMGLGAGKGGQAGHLDGTTYATTASSTAIKPPTAVTWMCWLTRLNTGTFGWGQVFGRCNDDASWGDTFSIYTYQASANVMPVLTTTTAGGSPAYYTGDGDGLVATVPVGTWMHVAATWSAADGVLRWYVDGSLIGSTTRADPSLYYSPVGGADRRFNIGRNEAYNERAANLAIDEVRVFDTALSGSEIVTEMNTRSGGVAPTSLPYLVMAPRGRRYTY